MDCPVCDYAMSKTDLTCPRCALMAANAARTTPAPQVPKSRRSSQASLPSILTLQRGLRTPACGRVRLVWPSRTPLRKWMRDEAEKRIGHLYPKVNLPQEMGGAEATVIAWIWARTVKCNAACGCQMPLVRSFALSTKAGKQAWVEPVIDAPTKTIAFNVKSGIGTPREATVGKRGAVCLCCNSPVPLDHVRTEGKAKRIGAQLMAIVAEGQRNRIYLAPVSEHEAIAVQAEPKWSPTTYLPEQALGFRVQGYALTTHADLFTSRQLVALSTFSDLVSEARRKSLKTP